MITRERAGKLNEQIQIATAPVYRIRRLSVWEERKNLIYSVSLKKSSELTLEERTALFYECLKDNLNSDEKIVCGNKSFIISDGIRTLTYCLEAYRKHCNKICYVENSIVKTELIHRICCEDAFHMIKKKNSSKEVERLKRSISIEIKSSPFSNPNEILSEIVKKHNSGL